MRTCTRFQCTRVRPLGRTKYHRVSAWSTILLNLQPLEYVSEIFSFTLPRWSGCTYGTQLPHLVSLPVNKSLILMHISRCLYRS